MGISVSESWEDDEEEEKEGEEVIKPSNYRISHAESYVFFA